MASVMKVMRGTTAGWSAKEAEGIRLGSGQIGYNKDTKELKVGDGTTAFASLPNINAGANSNIYTNNGINFSGTSTTIFPITIKLQSAEENTSVLNFSVQRLPNTCHLIEFYPSSTAIVGIAHLGTDESPWSSAYVNTINTNRLQVDENSPRGKEITIAASLIPVPARPTDRPSVGTSTSPWPSVWSGSLSNNDDLILNAIGANGADMKQITLRLSTADEDPSGIRSITFDSSSFSNYGSTLSLGTAENPWKDAYVANSIYMEDVGSGAAVPGMSIRYNADEEAIEFLAE